MAMKFFCVLLLCVAACVTAAPNDNNRSADEHSGRFQRGICITFCGANGVQCPNGYECRGNGCGHQCYRSQDYSQPEGCPMLKCAYNCELGYKKDKQGCETCDCDYSALSNSDGK